MELRLPIPLFYIKHNSRPMKKLLLTPAFLFCFYFSYGQLLYYVRPNLQTLETYFGVFNIATCMDSIIFPIDFQPDAGALDIAVCPDGNFYVAISNGNFPFYQVGMLNFIDSSVTVLSDLSYSVGNSLVCDGNGLLWFGPDLFSYNTHTAEVVHYGYVGYPLAGDMTYRDDKLYGITLSNELVEIDPFNLSATHVVYQAPLTDVIAYGVVSFSESCD